MWQLKKCTLGFSLLLGVVLGTGNASGALIAMDDFDALGGWSDNRLSTVGALGNATILGGVGQFGTGVTATQTFALSGAQTSVDIAFRAIHFDSWDSGERFRMLIDGVEAYSRVFNQAVFGPDETQFNEPGPVNRTDAFVDVVVNHATTANSITRGVHDHIGSGCE